MRPHRPRSTPGRPRRERVQSGTRGHGARQRAVGPGRRGCRFASVAGSDPLPVHPRPRHRRRSVHCGSSGAVGTPSRGVHDHQHPHHPGRATRRRTAAETGARRAGGPRRTRHHPGVPDHPVPGAAGRRAGVLGLGHQLGGPGRRGGLLHDLHPGHHRRVPPPLHARRVQGPPSAADRARRGRRAGRPGLGHRVGRRPPPAPRVLRPRGGSALAVAVRRFAAGARARLLARPHGVAVRPGPHQRRPVRAGPGRGPRAPGGGPAVPAVDRGQRAGAGRAGRPADHVLVGGC